MSTGTATVIVSAVSAAISLGVLILSIFQSLRQTDLIKRTKAMDVKVNRLAVELDQSLNLLYHTRDQAKALQHLFIVTRNPKFQTGDNIASVFTHVADLDALVRTIGNDKLKEIWEDGIGKSIRSHGATPDSLLQIVQAGEISEQTANLLAVIYELIKNATADKPLPPQTQPRLAWLTRLPRR